MFQAGGLLMESDFPSLTISKPDSKPLFGGGDTNANDFHHPI
jgi:hypothetical protein